MILHCTFEELSAFSAAAGRVLSESTEHGAAVAAPPEILAELETLTNRLDGDISVITLAEQRALLRVINFVLADLRVRMDAAVLEYHPAGEAAVQTYFDYAHVLVLQDRLRRMGEQMSALIELMTGAPPNEISAKQVGFPD